MKMKIILMQIKIEKNRIEKNKKKLKYFLYVIMNEKTLINALYPKPLINRIVYIE